MNASESLERLDPLDKVFAAAMEYEPTPQEIRWAMIEHRARSLVSAIRKTGTEGMTPEAREALDDLSDELNGEPA